MHTLASFALFILLTSHAAFAGTVHTSSLQPHAFIINKGQWPAHVVAATRSGDADIFITRTGMVVDRLSVDAATGTRADDVVALTFDAARPGRVEQGKHVGTTSFFLGNNATQWRTAPMVESLTLNDVYDGIDVVYRYDNNHVRFDVHVAGFASADVVTLRVEGAVPTPTTNNVITFGNSGIAMSDLVVLQQGRTLDAAMRVDANAQGARIGFDISGRDIARPMIIDPIVYGTYLGSGLDTYGGIRRLANGDVVVAGGTPRLRFPGSTGGFKAEAAAGSDIFVALFDSSLSSVKSYTFLGGAADELVTAVTSDAQGAIYLTGTTTSADFPTSTGSAGQVYRGARDAVVVKLTSGVANLAIGAFIGGNADDVPHAIALDGDLNIYIAGETRSTSGFPVNNGFQKTHGGALDGFFTKISTNGSAVVYSSYMGKSSDDAFTSIAVNSAGGLVLTGYSASSTWHVHPRKSPPFFPRGAYQEQFAGGRTDAVVVSLGPSGSDIKFSTYLGGNGDDVGKAINLDAQGRPVIVMVTTTPDLQIVGGQYQNGLGGKDLGLFTFNLDGDALTASTYFGGSDDDDLLCVTPDAGSSIIVGGSTKSMDFPLRGAGSNVERRGATDGFVTILSTAATRSSNLIVGAADDAVVAIDGDPNGDVYFIATTSSNNLPTSRDSYSRTFNGPTTGYIGKLAQGVVLLSAPSGGETICASGTTTISWGANEMLSSDRYNVEMSADSGATWTSVASQLRTTSHVWQLRDVQPSKYLVRVRSSRGHTVQTESEVTIVAPPSIARQPAPVADCEGRPASVSILAQGEGLSYQWRRNNTNIAGATEASYTISALTPATVGRYDCIVTGRCSPVATSQGVDVAIVNAPVITTQPSSQIIDKGQRLTLSVEALGSALQYQWLKNGQPIADATAAAFEIAAVTQADAGDYTCRVTSDCGTTLSQAATIVINDGTSVGTMALLEGVRIVGPNPASSAITLELPTHHGDVTVEAHALTGELAARHTTASERYALDVSSWPTGVYLLRVQSGGRAFNATLTVVR
jgi:hypothetical protein